MKDMLVVFKLKEGKLEKYLGFMGSDAGLAERKKFADVTKTVVGVAPDKIAFMAQILYQNLFGMKLGIAMKFMN